MQTKQIPENKELLKKTDYKAKITDIGNKLSRISGLATTVALNAVESKTPNFSNLVKKKTDYDPKISNIESKYFTTADYEKI